MPTSAFDHTLTIRAARLFPTAGSVMPKVGMEH